MFGVNCFCLWFLSKTVLPWKRKQTEEEAATAAAEAMEYVMLFIARFSEPHTYNGQAIPYRNRTVYKKRHEFPIGLACERWVSICRASALSRSANERAPKNQNRLQA